VFKGVDLVVEDDPTMRIEDDESCLVAAGELDLVVRVLPDERFVRRDHLSANWLA
jgi:hypothetical protein